MANAGVLSAMAPAAGPARDAASGRIARQPPRLTLARVLVIALVTAALTTLAVWVAVTSPYTPGSTLGYNLGLVGGVLLLTLLLYPLRKRWRVFARLGRMAGWFRFHMVAGVGGPLLLLFHSTFKPSSVNGSVALYAMLLVAGSGLFGRYIYRHMHRGLYGRRLTLDEAKADLLASRASIDSVFALRPDIEARLMAFHDYAFAPLAGAVRRVRRFVTLRWQARRLSRAVRHELKATVARVLHAGGNRPRDELAVDYHLARVQTLCFLNAVVQTSQLAAWTRLFSLWHLVHIPFLYLLLFAGIVHVLAVHMY